MKRDYRKIESVKLDDIKGKKIEMGKPELDNELAAIIECKIVQEDKDSYDTTQKAYRNMGLQVVYSLEIDGKVREITERLMGLRKYPSHLWSSKDS